MKYLIIFLLCALSVIATNLTLNTTVDVNVDNQSMNLSVSGSLIQSFNLSNLQNTSFVVQETQDVNLTTVVLNVSVNEFPNMTIVNNTVDVTNCDEELLNAEFQNLFNGLENKVVEVNDKCVDEINALADKANANSEELKDCRVDLTECDSQHELNETVCKFNKEGLERDNEFCEKELTSALDGQKWMFGLILVLVCISILVILVHEGILPSGGIKFG